MGVRIFQYKLSQLEEIITMAESWPNFVSLHWIWGNKIKAYGLGEPENEEEHDHLQKILNSLY